MAKPIQVIKSGSIYEFYGKSKPVTKIVNLSAIVKEISKDLQKPGRVKIVNFGSALVIRPVPSK